MIEKVPEGWIRGQLDSVVSKFIVPMRDKPKAFSGDIPWVRIEDFNGKYLSRSKSGRNVDPSTIESMNLKIYPKGTVLCSCSARLGVCAITSRELVSNQTFIGLYPGESIDAELLFYTMESHSEDLQRLSSGTTIAYLPREKFEEFEILIPPLPEQKKIASILTSVDEVIETTQRQIDKLQDLKKATMNELLTKGIGHTEFKDSELGRIPKSWDVITLFELASDGISNGVFNDPKMQGSGYRLINVYDMYQGFGINDKKLRKLKLSEKDFQKNKVKHGDIFLTRSSLKLEGIAHCNICLSHADDLTYDGHLMKISPDTSKVEPIFLALQCLSDLGRKFLMRMAKQSTMTTIGQEDIAPLLIALPPMAEQRKIIDVHNGFESRINQLKNKFHQTEFLKKSLMQDLLTGRVRVEIV